MTVQRHKDTSLRSHIPPASPPKTTTPNAETSGNKGAPRCAHQPANHGETDTPKHITSHGKTAHNAIRCKSHSKEVPITQQSSTDYTTKRC